MNIDIISLFPEMFEGPLGHSIIKRAREADILKVSVTNPRDFTYDKHRIVDDYPFGGGSGMVMKPEPIFRTVESITSKTAVEKRRIIMMCPSGQRLDQAKVRELANYEHLILICGHYEGIDERVKQHLVDETVSVGDYVLTGGELPAMIVVDAVARMLPGVLGSSESAPHDSFYNGLLEYPQYTRPREYNGMTVPDILLSGDHAKINRWRQKESLRKTLEYRPDLLHNIALSSEDARLLAEVIKEQSGG